MFRSASRAIRWSVALCAATASAAAAQSSPRACPGDVTSRALDSLSAIVRDASPACLWVQLGRARVAAAGRGDLARSGPRQYLGIDYAHGAGNAFLHALELDPTLLVAARELIEVLPEQGGWPQEDDAMRALRRVNAAVDSPPPWLLLGRARLERVVGDRDSSAVLLRRYLAAGGDSVVGWLELARELYHAGKADEAHAAYLAGAQSVHSPEDAAPYRESVALVASPAELVVLDSTPADSISAFVTRFWARRDADAGRPDGERLAEHYRRFEVAERSFRPIGDSSPVAPFLFGTAAAPADPLASSDPTLLTDSTGLPLIALLDSSMLSRHPRTVNGYTLPGAVWLRQGPPDNFAGNFWKYDDGTRWLVIEVGGRRFGNVCDLATRYCGPASGIRRQRWHKEWMEMLDSSLTTDAYPVRFDHRLAPVVNVYGLLAPSGPGGLALVVFAVRISNLKPRPVPHDPTHTAFPLAFRVIAYTPSGVERFELDTTRWLAAPAATRGSAWLTGTLTLPLPAGLYNSRVVIEELPLRSPDAGDSLPVDSRGSVIGRDSMIVPGTTALLAMSDVVPGRGDGGMAWRNGSLVFTLNPLSTWRRGEPIELQYELAGLEPGSMLRTQIRLTKGNDSTHAVTLSFSDQVRRARQAFQRAVGTTRLASGGYTLEVEVTTERGVTAVRRARVVIGE